MYTTQSQRNGLTLIELLVVVSIIGLLAVLIVPAIQSSREASRKMECSNHLKQMGLALAGFQAANRSFPTLGTGIQKQNGNYVGNGSLSLHFQLLPFMEQKVLFDSINYQPNIDVATNSYDHIVNRTALKTRLNTFLCPSDRSFDAPGNNYRGNIGPNPYFLKTQISLAVVVR